MPKRGAGRQRGVLPNPKGTPHGRFGRLAAIPPWSSCLGLRTCSRQVHPVKPQSQQATHAQPHGPQMKPTHTKYNPRTHHMYPLSQHISCRPVCADTGKSTKRHDKQRPVNKPLGPIGCALYRMRNACALSPAPCTSRRMCPMLHATWPMPHAPRASCLPPACAPTSHAPIHTSLALSLWYDASAHEHKPVHWSAPIPSTPSLHQVNADGDGDDDAPRHDRQRKALPQPCGRVQGKARAL